MFITFIGNDGSGKSTLAGNFVERLASNDNLVLMIGEFDYFVLSFIKKLFRKDTIQRAQANLNSGASPSRFTYALPYIIYIDLLLQYMYIRLVLSWRMIVVRDRYAFDFLMTWKELGVANKLIDYLYLHFPSADLTYYVDVEADTAHQRRNRQRGKAKDDTFYEKKVALYHAHLNKIKRVVIDNNTENMQVASEKVLAYFALKQKLERVHTIAISGLDGAGKSTTVVQLSQLLGDLNIRHFTTHFYYQYIVTKLFGVGRQKADSEQDQHRISLAAENAHRAKGKSRLWVWFVLSDAYLQYFFAKVVHPRSVIIYDRFFSDYLVSFAFLHAPHNPNGLAKWFPRTDRYFLQIADYELLHKRKPEHSLDFFRECYNHYVQLAKVNEMSILNSTKRNEREILAELISQI